MGCTGLQSEYNVSVSSGQQLAGNFYICDNRRILMTGKGIQHWMAFLLAWVVQAHNVLAFGKAPFTRGQWIKAWVGRHMWRKRHNMPSGYGMGARHKRHNTRYAYIRVHDERVNEWYNLLSANAICGHGHYAMTESGIIFRGCDHTGPAKWAKWRKRSLPKHPAGYYDYSGGILWYCIARYHADSMFLHWQALGFDEGENNVLHWQGPGVYEHFGRSIHSASPWRIAPHCVTIPQALARFDPRALVLDWTAFDET